MVGMGRTRRHGGRHCCPACRARLSRLAHDAPRPPATPLPENRQGNTPCRSPVLTGWPKTQDRPMLPRVFPARAGMERGMCGRRAVPFNVGPPGGGGYRYRLSRSGQGPTGPGQPARLSPLQCAGAVREASLWPVWRYCPAIRCSRCKQARASSWTAPGTGPVASMTAAFSS